jgi:hypothetical protein
MGVYLFGYAVVCFLWAAIFIAIAFENHAASVTATVATLICVGLLAGSNGWADSFGTTPARPQSSSHALHQFPASEPGEIPSPRLASGFR